MSSDPSPPGDATALIVRSLRIDRSSPVPLWFQAAQGMENLIASGELPPGSRLDNEVLLSEKLNLSRPTMRRALEYLVDHGMLVRRRGVGTRVVQPKVRRPLGLTSLYEDLAESGQRPQTRVLTNEIVPASSAVAQALELEEGADVVHLVRLRTAGDQPIAKLINYLPVELVELPTDDVERRGLYELLRSAGVRLHSATQTIGARKATAEEARLLNEARGAALLTMQRNAYDDHSRPVEHGSHVYAASRYSFQTQLLSPG
jgi:GntR family transcriptional regulator